MNFVQKIALVLVAVMMSACGSSMVGDKPSKPRFSSSVFPVAAALSHGNGHVRKAAYTPRGGWSLKDPYVDPTTGQKLIAIVSENDDHSIKILCEIRDGYIVFKECVAQGAKSKQRMQEEKVWDFFTNSVPALASYFSGGVSTAASVPVNIFAQAISQQQQSVRTRTKVAANKHTGSKRKHRRKRKHK